MSSARNHRQAGDRPRPFGGLLLVVGVLVGATGCGGGCDELERIVGSGERVARAPVRSADGRIVIETLPPGGSWRVEERSYSGEGFSAEELRLRQRVDDVQLELVAADVQPDVPETRGSWGETDWRRRLLAEHFGEIESLSQSEEGRSALRLVASGRDPGGRPLHFNERRQLAGARVLVTTVLLHGLPPGDATAQHPAHGFHRAVRFVAAGQPQPAAEAPR